jgi:hypothetical protein
MEWMNRKRRERTEAAVLKKERKRREKERKRKKIAFLSLFLSFSYPVGDEVYCTDCCRISKRQREERQAQARTKGEAN